MCTNYRFHQGPSSGLVRRFGWLRLAAVLAAAAAVVATSACAGGGAVAGAGPADPAAAAAVAEATAPATPLQINFDWELRDRDARFNGQGVVRLDRNYRARLDLFGPRGETLSAAIIEGEEMRVVPAGTESLLPPPALLWSALGVFRPPVDAPLTGTSRDGDGFTLTYGRDGTAWTFRFENDALRSTEWSSRGARRTVQLSGNADFGLPAQSSFRDWSEFRELTMRLTNVEESTGYGSDVWVLPGGE
jgi:hypothetical protein